MIDLLRKTDWFKILFLKHNTHLLNNLLKLDLHIKERNKIINVFPEYNNIFKCFELTSYKDVKLVIIGQEPYNNNQSNGLAFSSNKKSKTLDIIHNTIVKEHNRVSSDILFNKNINPNLERWAKQNILLLNLNLTVEEKKPFSHSKIGWEIFIKQVIDCLNDKEEKIIYFLWGKQSQLLEQYINKNHIIYKGEHPVSVLYNDLGEDNWKFEGFIEAKKYFKNIYNKDLFW